MTQFKIERATALCGLVFLACFFGAFALGGFIPPLQPSLSAAEVAEHYRSHTTGIRFGAALMLLASIPYLAFTACIAVQMSRMSGITPVLRYLQLVSGCLLCVTFLVPAMLFFTTAYRPERAPELTQLLNDMSWFIAIPPFPPIAAQFAALGIAMFCDQRTHTPFPRWLAYLNVWAPTIFASAILAPFVKTGPFTWNGLVVFWLAGVVFSTMLIANALFMRRSALAEEARSTAPTISGYADGAGPQPLVGTT